MINEWGTSKLCCKCGDEMKEITNKEKKINGREYKEWSLKDRRNVRYCENAGCILKPYDKFFIDRDINAAINILRKSLYKLLGGKQPKNITGEHLKMLLS